MRELLEAGVHFGHQTRRWNPKMKRFIFGERGGIYIIDLQQTLERLEEAAAFARNLAERGGSVLFVGTKKQSMDTIGDPDEADYVIPGNDDAIRSCSLVIRAIADALEAGKAKVTPAEMAAPAAEPEEPAAEEQPEPPAEEPKPQAEAPPEPEAEPAPEGEPEPEAAPEVATAATSPPAGEGA